MAKKPEEQKPVTWTIYKIAAASNAVTAIRRSDRCCHK